MRYKKCKYQLHHIEFCNPIYLNVFLHKQFSEKYEYTERTHRHSMIYETHNTKHTWKHQCYFRSLFTISKWETISLSKHYSDVHAHFRQDSLSKSSPLEAEDIVTADKI